MTSPSQSVLVIDDESQIRRFLKVALEPHGLNVIEADTGHAGIVAATTRRPDLIILDLGLPDIPGIEVLRRLREWYEQPIIILSVRDDEGSIVTALDTGADDYLTKPFNLGELLARMRVSMRKLSTISEPVILVGDFKIDVSAHRVSRAGVEIRLTSTEFSLLAVLARHAGKVLTHGQILKSIWGPNSSEHVQYIRVYIGHLRQKIELNCAEPRLILTEPGVGYRFCSPTNDQ